MNKARKIVAILISPFVTAIVFSMLFIGGNVGDYAVMLYIISIPVFYIGAIFIGYPSISYLKRRDKLSILWFSLSGFIIGFVIANLGIILFYITSLWDPAAVEIINRASFTETLNTVLVAGISCAFGALLYGLISGITQKGVKSLTRHSKPTPKDGAV